MSRWSTDEDHTGQGEDDARSNSTRPSPASGQGLQLYVLLFGLCRRDNGLHSGVLALIAPQWHQELCMRPAFDPVMNVWRNFMFWLSQRSREIAAGAVAAHALQGRVARRNFQLRQGRTALSWLRLRRVKPPAPPRPIPFSPGSSTEPEDRQGGASTGPDSTSIFATRLIGLQAFALQARNWAGCRTSRFRKPCRRRPRSSH